MARLFSFPSESKTWINQLKLAGRSYKMKWFSVPLFLLGKQRLLILYHSRYMITTMGIIRFDCSKSFWSKLHKNLSKIYIYFFTRFQGQLSSIALVQSNIWHEKCLILYLYLDIFWLNIVRPKTSDKLSVNIDHV